MLDLGKGSGPMNHAFAIAGEYGESEEMSGWECAGKSGVNGVRTACGGTGDEK